MNPKLTDERLSRRAIVYVRQSSPGQVIHNQESQRRQYALVERARELGFKDTVVIDDDLGRSGSGLVERPGFQRLVGEVCTGEVGAIFCIEASRLARNGRDWHHLIELCGMVSALVVDPDGVYDPAIINDRLHYFAEDPHESDLRRGIRVRQDGCPDERSRRQSTKDRWTQKAPA